MALTTDTTKPFIDINLGNLPDLGRRKDRPSELLFLGPCPNCGGAMFAHTETYTNPLAVYATCECGVEPERVSVPEEYVADRERAVVEVLFAIISQLQHEVIRYATAAEEVLPKESTLVGDELTAVDHES